jgi:phage-related protein
MPNMVFNALNSPDQYIHRIWGSNENSWELRVIFAGQQERVLFLTLVEGRFLLTHGFQKTIDKIPQLEITRAENIYYNIPLQHLHQSRGC